MQQEVLSKSLGGANVQSVEFKEHSWQVVASEHRQMRTGETQCRKSPLCLVFAG